MVKTQQANQQIDHILKEPDHYKRLGISENESMDEIKRAFKGLQRTIHVDRQPEELKPKAQEAMKRLNETRDVLLDTGRREAYDRTRRPQESPVEQQGWREASGPSGFRESFDMERQYLRTLLRAEPSPEGLIEWLKNTTPKDARYIGSALNAGIEIGYLNAAKINEDNVIMFRLRQALNTLYESDFAAGQKFEETLKSNGIWRWDFDQFVPSEAERAQINSTRQVKELVTTIDRANNAYSLSLSLKDLRLEDGALESILTNPAVEEALNAFSGRVARELQINPGLIGGLHLAKDLRGLSEQKIIFPFEALETIRAGYVSAITEITRAGNSTYLDSLQRDLSAISSNLQVIGIDIRADAKNAVGAWVVSKLDGPLSLYGVTDSLGRALRENSLFPQKSELEQMPTVVRALENLLEREVVKKLNEGIGSPYQLESTVDGLVSFVRDTQLFIPDSVKSSLTNFLGRSRSIPQSVQSKLRQLGVEIPEPSNGTPASESATPQPNNSLDDVSTVSRILPNFSKIEEPSMEDISQLAQYLRRIDTQALQANATVKQQLTEFLRDTSPKFLNAIFAAESMDQLQQNVDIVTKLYEHLGEEINLEARISNSSLDSNGFQEKFDRFALDVAQEVRTDPSAISKLVKLTNISSSLGNMGIFMRVKVSR